MDAGLEFGSSVCASSLCPDFLSGCEIAWDRVYLNEVNYKNEAFFLSVLMVRDPSLESALRRRVLPQWAVTGRNWRCQKLADLHGKGKTLDAGAECL